MASLASAGAFLLASFLLCGSLAPATTVPGFVDGALASADPSAALPATGWDTKVRLDGIAADLAASTEPLSAQIAGLAGVQMPAPEAPSQSLAEALARLAVQAGFPADVPQPPGFAALPAETQAAVAGVVDGVRESARLVDAAFAGLTTAERAELQAGLLDLDLPATTPEQAARDSRLESLAARVDGGAMRAAGLVLLRAAEQVPGTLPEPALPASGPTPFLPVPPPAGAPPSGVGTMSHTGSCGSFGASLVDFTGMVEIGMAMDNGYTTPRVAIVDLSGNECYDNYPASVAPGIPGSLPVGVIVDLSGNDEYYAFDLASSPGTVLGIAVGIGGVGVIEDRNGDDFYGASVNNQPLNCGVFPYGPNDSWQRLYAQGVGFLGVGVISDDGGNDNYVATNQHNLGSSACTFSHAYTYAQGVGGRLGIGVVSDDGGNDDRYSVSARSSGKPFNMAHAHGQSAATARGFAGLLNAEGHDRYSLSADAQASAIGARGNSAYVFGQAALYGTNEPRDEMIGVNIEDAGFVTSASLSCSTASVGPPVAPGGSAQVGPPCDVQAVALLLDAIGSDSYSADAYATDNGLGCSEGVWAGAVAQGSAPAKGLASFTDLGLDEFNGFSVSSTAQGQGCASLGVRSGTYAQGFGGAMLWDHYDAPPFDPLLFTDLSIGVMSRGGDCGFAQPAVKVMPTPPFVVISSPGINTNDPCPEAWTSDFYGASAYATDSGGGLSWARTFAQGSGNGQVAYTFPGGSRAFDALGLGIHGDGFGYDSYAASTAADGAAPDAFTVAQGAGDGAYGILVNIEGNDRYFATTSENGATLNNQVYEQADAATPGVSVTVCVAGFFCSTNTFFLGGGIFVDALGLDSYYPGLANGYCPEDAAVIAPPLHTWGNVVTFPTPGCVQGTGIVVGVDLNL